MPRPLIWTLPKTARDAYPFILSGTRRGLSSRAVEAELRAAGFRISRGRSILPTMRAIKAQDESTRRLRFTPKGNMVNVNRLPTAITNVRREFNYEFTATGIDASNQRISRTIMVTTDNARLTMGELESLAEQIAGGSTESGGLEEIEVRLTGAFRKASLPPR